jgi:hypothetical protein
MELPMMSSDEERNFDMVLRSLGVRETTINFVYEQSVKEVLHLLLIEEDDITSWKHDRYLSAIECQILFKLRTHVHMRKSNNDDRLPSDWHIGLTLETLSSPSKPNVATRADSPPPLVVFVRLLGLANAWNLTRYRQFVLLPTEIFRDVLRRFLTKAVQDGLYTEEQSVELMTKSPTILYSQAHHENAKCHQLAVLSDSSFGVFLT